MVLTIQNKNYTDAALRDLQNYFDQLGELYKSLLLRF